MAEMVVKLTWDDELAPRWMNIDNLNSCLFGKTHVKPSLLEVEVLSCSADETDKDDNNGGVLWSYEYAKD